MFLNQNATPVQLIAQADVCQTPTSGPPVPVPYPNISSLASQANGFAKVVITGGVALRQSSKAPVSSGDEAGTGGGVLSGMTKGASMYNSGSTKLIYGGFPAVRMTDIQSANFNNVPVATQPAPTQTKVQAMS